MGRHSHRASRTAGAVVIATICVLYAAGPYIGPHVARRLRSDKNGRSPWGDNPQDLAAALRGVLVCPLPDGWQADYRSGILWITHYNPNGTVADCLPFSSPRGFYNWVEAHPDFCDVNVADLAQCLSKSSACQVPCDK